MKILFATPYVPMVTKPRPHHFMAELVERGHDVHLLMAVSSERDLEAAAADPRWIELERRLGSVHHVVQPKFRSWIQCAASLPPRTPLRVAYCYSKTLARRAESLHEEHRFDILHVDRERLAPVLQHLRLPKVLDPTDSMTMYLKRLVEYGPRSERFLARLELPKMPSFERRMGTGYDACLVTSTLDAIALEAVGCRPVPTVLPNGIADALLEAPREDGSGLVLFVGNMHYPPNVDAITWFARSSWPEIRTRHPEARLVIVGAKPVQAVMDLADEATGIEVKGWVAEVTPFLQRASVFVSPMRIGGGFPNKLAEALAAGAPAVSSTEGHAGLPGLTIDDEILEASSAAEFVEQIDRLLMDPSLRRKIGEGGRDFAGRKLRWSEVGNQLESIYLKAQENWSRARYGETDPRPTSPDAPSKEP